MVLSRHTIRTLKLTNTTCRPRMSTSRLDSSQDTPRCFDILSALPVELSLHILCFIQELSTLGRLPLVCKAWKILLQDESIWRLQSERFGYVPVNGGEVHDVWNGWREYFIKLYITGKIYHIENSSVISNECFLDSNWHSDRNTDSSDSITILRKDERSATCYPADSPSDVANRFHAGFSCDALNRWLALGFVKDATEIFDLRTGRLIYRLKDPDGSHMIEFLRVGEVDRLATAGSGRVARVWDPISG